MVVFFILLFVSMKGCPWSAETWTLICAQEISVHIYCYSSSGLSSCIQNWLPGLSLLIYYDFLGIFQNQFFISGFLGDDVIQNRLLEALYKRILRAVDEKKCFRVIIVIPLLPGFQVTCFKEHSHNLQLHLWTPLFCRVA